MKVLRYTCHNHHKAVPCSLAARATAAASSWCFLRKSPTYCVRGHAFTRALPSANQALRLRYLYLCITAILYKLQALPGWFRCALLVCTRPYIVCDGRSLRNVLTPGRVGILVALTEKRLTDDAEGEELWRFHRSSPRLGTVTADTGWTLCKLTLECRCRVRTKLWPWWCKKKKRLFKK